jgi:hypothetical protein
MGETRYTLNGVPATGRAKEMLDVATAMREAAIRDGQAPKFPVEVTYDRLARMILDPNRLWYEPTCRVCGRIANRVRAAVIGGIPRTVVAQAFHYIHDESERAGFREEVCTMKEEGAV